MDIAREYGYEAEVTPWKSTVSPTTAIMAAIGLVTFDVLVGLAILVHW